MRRYAGSTGRTAQGELSGVFVDIDGSGLVGSESAADTVVLRRARVCLESISKSLTLLQYGCPTFHGPRADGC